MARFFSDVTPLLSPRIREAFIVVDALVDYQHFGPALTRLTDIIDNPAFTESEKKVSLDKMMAITSVMDQQKAETSSLSSPTDYPLSPVNWQHIDEHSLFARRQIATIYARSGDKAKAYTILAEVLDTLFQKKDEAAVMLADDRKVSLSRQG